MQENVIEELEEIKRKRIQHEMKQSRRNMNGMVALKKKKKKVGGKFPWQYNANFYSQGHHCATIRSFETQEISTDTDGFIYLKRKHLRRGQAEFYSL